MQQPRPTHSHLSPGMPSLVGSHSTSSSNFELIPPHLVADMDALLDLSAMEAPLFGMDLTSPPSAMVEDTNELMAPSAPLTVSPSELMRDPQASAPPSTAFTNLTSPSVFESPDAGDSFETSPMFGGETDLTNGPWFSLFPAVVTDGDDSPPNGGEVLDDVLEPVNLALNHGGARRQSSPFDSPQPSRSSPVKHSSVAGVSSRKRDKPLPPIRIEDPSDSIAMKRARNTLAARKSRQRKVERVEELERMVEDLRGRSFTGKTWLSAVVPHLVVEKGEKGYSVLVWFGGFGFVAYCAARRPSPCVWWMGKPRAGVPSCLFSSP